MSDGLPGRRPAKLELFKRGLVRAALSQGNVTSGAVAVAASAVLWNPLPLILWGLGSAGWLTLGSDSGRFSSVLEEEDRHRRLQAVAAQQAELLATVTRLLTTPPLVGWVRSGSIPDYLASYRRLAGIRARVGRITAERGEVDADGSVGNQLEYMLGAYLQFIRARIMYLQVLADSRLAEPGVGSSNPPRAVVPPVARTGPIATPAAARLRGPGPVAVPPPLPSPPPLRDEPPDVDARLEVLRQRIAELKGLAESQPDTRRTREWHAGILEKQCALLEECRRRDQMVVAQLHAFPDVFDVILARVSAAQFSPTEFASYMGSVVEQVEETERFVESVRPAIDEMMVGTAGR